MKFMMELDLEEDQGKPNILTLLPIMLSVGKSIVAGGASYGDIHGHGKKWIGTYAITDGKAKKYKKGVDYEKIVRCVPKRTGDDESRRSDALPELLGDRQGETRTSEGRGEESHSFRDIPRDVPRKTRVWYPKSDGYPG